MWRGAKSWARTLRTAIGPWLKIARADQSCRRQRIARRSSALEHSSASAAVRDFGLRCSQRSAPAKLIWEAQSAWRGGKIAPSRLRDAIGPQQRPSMGRNCPTTVADCVTHFCPRMAYHLACVSTFPEKKVRMSASTGEEVSHAGVDFAGRH